MIERAKEMLGIIILTIGILITIAIFISIILAVLDRFSEGIYISKRKVVDNWDWLIKRWAEDIKTENQMEEVLVGATQIYFEKNWNKGALLKIRKTRDIIYIQPKISVPSKTFHIIIFLLLFFFGIGVFLAIYVHLKSTSLGKTVLSSIQLKCKKDHEMQEIIEKEKSRFK